MYLYVIREDGLDRVPELLLERFDDPELALSFKLTPSRKLAIAAATPVFNALLGVVYINSRTRSRVSTRIQQWCVVTSIKVVVVATTHLGT